MTKAKALATTIGTLGLVSQTVNTLITFFFQHFGDERPEEAEKLRTLRYDSRELRRLRVDIGNTLSVGDILRTYNKLELEDPNPYRDKTGPFKGQVWRNFSQKLVGLGLTRLDWIHLPQSTMDKVELSKKEWLDQPVILLGTLSGIATRWLEQRKALLVRDLLTFDVSGLYGSRDLYRSFLKTHEKLVALGFTRGDGVFMRIYSKPTKEEVIRVIASRAKLTPRQAKHFVDTAAKVGPYHDLWSWQ